MIKGGDVSASTCYNRLYCLLYCLQLLHVLLP
jgi:hypothetical protein